GIQGRFGTAGKLGRSGCPARNQQQKDRAHHTLLPSQARRSCGFWTRCAPSGFATFLLPKSSTLSWTKERTSAASGRSPFGAVPLARRSWSAA
ncbi:MAG: hypothetical protein QW794_08320, partial [Thermosphaera sp.]